MLNNRPNNTDLRRRNELVNQPAYEVMVFFHKVLKQKYKQLNTKQTKRSCVYL